ncbi:MAG: hypothetical protein KGL10_04500, partial [Alphaproteobacteria bacterium]|nr:hypothetical protein [Alphaproteobacteria bacterium]
DTGVFDQNMTAPVKLSFLPVEKMPHINVNGTVTLQDGVNLAGELSVSNGSLASLINVPALGAFDFWNADVNLKGSMIFKGNRFALRDMDADFGQGGRLRGKISVQVPRKGVRNIEANLSGDGLAVLSKPSDGYPEIPDGYKIDLGFKGKNVAWDGKTLETVSISTYSRKGDWLVRSAKVTLPGNSAVSFSGTVAPKTQSAIYTSLQITTDDLGKMVDAFNPDAANAFSLLGSANVPTGKMRLKGSLAISPAQTSLYDMDADFGDKRKVSGVLNVAQATAAQRPKFTAMLHFDGWNGGDFSDAFLKALLQSDADLQLTADNFSKGGLAISGIVFDGQTDAKGLTIGKFSGNLSGKDAFSMKGSVAGLAPVSGLDVSYALTAAHATDIAKSLGVSLPPVKGENFSVKGTVTKTATGAYAYTAAGQADGIVLQGQSVTHPSFSLDATKPSAVSISGLTGKMWGGTLQGSLDFTAGTPPVAWASAFKGSLKNADLSVLQAQLGLKGFSVGKGDIGFDLTSADNTAQNATGDISLQADKLTIGDFNADHLPEHLQKLVKIPDDLVRLVSDAMHHDGASVFNGVQGKFKLDHGKVSIISLKAENAAEKISLAGSSDIAKGVYALSGSLQLAKPEDFPALAVSRTSKDADYAIDGGKALQDYVSRHLPPPPAPKKRKPSVAAQKKKQDQPIGDILDRLDTESAAPEKPLPPQGQTSPLPATPKKPPLAIPGQTSINNLLQQMQTGDALKPDNSLPMSLTSP